jgi:hypothetical protein
MPSSPLVSTWGATVLVHLKKSHMAWKPMLRKIYIQHSHTLTHRDAFYKRQTVKAHIWPKTDNTSEHGVAQLKIKQNT